jgi:hypothetical protein
MHENPARNKTKMEIFFCFCDNLISLEVLRHKATNELQLFDFGKHFVESMNFKIVVKMRLFV